VFILTTAYANPSVGVLRSLCFIILLYLKGKNLKVCGGKGHAALDGKNVGVIQVNLSQISGQ
jgi:hypothetical protein